MDCRRKKLLAKFSHAAARKPGPRAWLRKGRSEMKPRCSRRRIKFGAPSAKRIGLSRSKVIRQSASPARDNLFRHNLRRGPNKNNKRLRHRTKPEKRR